MIELRDYQVAAVEDLRGGIRQGHIRQVLCAPTGSGKTRMAMFFVQAAAEKHRRVAFLCDRVALVEQTSLRFREAGIEHGVAQGENTFGRSMPVQVCSAQTIETRGFWPGLDLLIVDEAHSQRKATLKFLKGWGGITLGLTATPFAKGMADTYSRVVNARTTAKLLDDGWLAPLKVYAAREIEMDGAARKPGGEWADAEVERRGRAIVGDIVAEWQDKTAKHFGGPVKTLLFGPTVAYCEEICGAFQAAGFDFRASSYRDDADESRAMIEAFRAGEFVGLASVDKFSRGFDVPDVLCLIAARPYRKSFAAHIQQIGRVMRISPGKEFALLLDHAGNYLGFYDDMQEFFARGCTSLDAAKPDKDRERNPRKTTDPVCGRCGFIMEPGLGVCPSCGAERRAPRGRVAVSAGRMQQVDGVEAKAGAWKADRLWVWAHIRRVATSRHPTDETRARKFALAQYRNFYDAWPETEFAMDPRPADERVERAVIYRLKKWWRSQKNAA